MNCVLFGSPAAAAAVATTPDAAAATSQVADVGTTPAVTDAAASGLTTVGECTPTDNQAGDRCAEYGDGSVSYSCNRDSTYPSGKPFSCCPINLPTTLNVNNDGAGLLNTCELTSIVVGPTPAPSAGVTPGPTPDPTPGPTPDPTPGPTPDPTPGPTPDPTPDPTPGPTPDPTPGPTPDPTPGPTPDPTPGPTPDPTPGPTDPPVDEGGNNLVDAPEFSDDYAGASSGTAVYADVPTGNTIVAAATTIAAAAVLL